MKYESLVYVLGPRYKGKTGERNFQNKPNNFHLYIDMHHELLKFFETQSMLV